MNNNIIIKDTSITESNAEVIVNSWNTNIIPWFLLLPQGVSKAIKKTSGFKPFNELLKFGYLAPGKAILTCGGRLEPQKIIHVAALNIFWISNETIIRKCIKNSLDIAYNHNFKSMAFPLIGSGTGGVSKDKAKKIILEELNNCKLDINLHII